MKPTITFEFDDCFKETIENVLPLLKKYNLKATFAMIANPKIKKIVNQGHEISSNTLNHSALGERKIISLENIKKFNIIKKTIKYRKNAKQ